MRDTHVKDTTLPFQELPDPDLVMEVYRAFRPDFRQEDVARMVGLKQSHWSRLEAAATQGRRIPDLRTATRAGMIDLLRALGGDSISIAKAVGTQVTIQRIRKVLTDLEESLPPALRAVEDPVAPNRTPTPELPDPNVSPIQSAPGWHDEDYEPVRRYESEDVRLAAGTGTFAEQEPVAGEVKFRKNWLRKRRLRAKDLFLVDVLGDSMEPTICDGDSALVDGSRRSPLSGKIYALRATDGLLVKRLRKRDHRWWADSDNKKYEPQTLDDRARIMGRVVWWAHTD